VPRDAPRAAGRLPAPDAALPCPARRAAQEVLDAERSATCIKLLTTLLAARKAGAHPRDEEADSGGEESKRACRTPAAPCAPVRAHAMRARGGGSRCPPRRRVAQLAGCARAARSGGAHAAGRPGCLTRARAPQGVRAAALRSARPV
jgi:hypothetical protein